MAPVRLLPQFRQSPHGEVAFGVVKTDESKAAIKALSIAVVVPHAQDDRQLACGAFGQKGADESSAHPPAALFARQFDADQAQFLGASPCHPEPCIRSLDDDHRFLRAGKADAVIGATSVKLLPEKSVALREVPAAADEFVRSGVRIEAQKESVIRRRRRAKREGRRICVKNGFHTTVASPGGGLAAIPKNTAVCRPATFAIRPGGDA